MMLYCYAKIITQLIRDSTGDFFFSQVQDIEEISNMFKCKHKNQSHQ